MQQPNPKKRPLTEPDLDFNWNNWATLEDPPASRPALPKAFGQDQVEHVQQPNPKKRPPTGADPNFDWNYWMTLEDPAPPKDFGQAHEYQVKNVQQPKPGPSTDSNSDWISLDDLLPARPASQKEFGQAHEYQVGHLQQLKPGPEADPNFDWNYWMNVEDPPLRPASSKPLNPGPSNAGPSNLAPSDPAPSDLRPSSPGPSNPGPSNPGLPATEPELHSDHQSLSAESQPEDLEAAITYALKGKAKESRSISGTASDVGNAAQRELQPAERSPNPGE